MTVSKQTISLDSFYAITNYFLIISMPEYLIKELTAITVLLNQEDKNKYPT